MNNNLIISVNENPFELDAENFGDLTVLCRRLGKEARWISRNKPFISFLFALEKKYHPENKLEMSSGRDPVVMNSSFLKSSTGRYGGTRAHIFVLLYVASLFSPEIAIEAYESISQVDKILAALNDFDISEFEEELSATPVYVFSAVEVSTGNIKIGLSKNPEQRIKQLQQGNPDSIVLSGYFLAENPYKKKKEILESNHNNILIGDWLSERAIDSIPTELC